MLFRDILAVAAQPSGKAITLDADAALYFAAVVTAGGTVSNVRKNIINTFIVQEKASGAWALTDDYWGLWAENATQALVSLKQLRTATVVAAPTFTADQGYTFNGTSNYINTGFVPSTHCVAGSGTNQRLAVYGRSSPITGSVTLGSFTSATVNWRMFTSDVARTMTGRLNSGAAVVTVPSTGAGYLAMSRAGGGTIAKSYYNGAPLADATGLSVGTTLTANAIFIGAFNNAGSASGFVAFNAGFGCIGAPLSAAQEAAHYTNVQAWATAVGANV